MDPEEKAVVALLLHRGPQNPVEVAARVQVECRSGIRQVLYPLLLL